MKMAWTWLLAHKKEFGLGFLGMLAYVQMNPSMLEHAPMWLRHGVAMIGVFLVASGLVKSDSFYKNKLEGQKEDARVEALMDGGKFGEDAKQ